MYEKTTNEFERRKHSQRTLWQTWKTCVWIRNEDGVGVSSGESRSIFRRESCSIGEWSPLKWLVETACRDEGGGEGPRKLAEGTEGLGRVARKGDECRGSVSIRVSCNGEAENGRSWVMTTSTKTIYTNKCGTSTRRTRRKRKNDYQPLFYFYSPSLCLSFSFVFRRRTRAGTIESGWRFRVPFNFTTLSSLFFFLFLPFLLLLFVLPFSPFLPANDSKRVFVFKRLPYVRRLFPILYISSSLLWCYRRLTGLTRRISSSRHDLTIYRFTIPPPSSLSGGVRTLCIRNMRGCQGV